MGLFSLPNITAAFQQTVDKMGNIFNSDGSHAGVVAGSQADVGTGGNTVTPGIYTGGAQGSQGATPTSGLKLPSLPSLPNIFQGASDAAGAVASGTASAGNAIASVANRGIIDWVFLGIGLLLIAAGVFSFRSTQTIIQTAGKYAAKAGEVAAV